MMRRAVPAVILTVAFALAAGSAVLRREPPTVAAEPDPQLTGEDLWQSLPPELLANVIEGKLEAIASHRSCIRRLTAELARVREIQRSKLAADGIVLAE